MPKRQGKSGIDKNRRGKKQNNMHGRVEASGRGNVQAIEPGDDVIRGRLLERTRDQYGEKINKLHHFLLLHHPECVNDSDVLLPLPVNVVKMFLQHTSIKRSKNGVAFEPLKYNTFSHINGYNSAIKYIYKERKVSIDLELNEMMDGISFYTYQYL